MKLKEAFNSTGFSKEAMPMKTVQRQINQRPPKAHKFLKKAGKAFKNIGRKPNDVRERYNMPIPPTGARVQK